MTICESIKINNDWALLYGILAGDGCISKSGKHHFISVTCNIHDDEPFFQKIVIPLFEKIRNKKTQYIKRPKWGKIEINFSDKELFNSIKLLEFPVGKKENMKIPDMFTDDFYTHVISGYFSTDGSLVLANNNGSMYPRIEIQCKSVEILKQTKEFLIRNGMKGNVYKMLRKYPNGKERIMYRLQFNGHENLISFRDIIGFINPKHEKKFKKYIKCRCGSGVRAPHI